MADELADWMDGPWAVEPDSVPRVAPDVEKRAARLRAIGNGQVPMTAAVAFLALSRRLQDGKPE